MFSDGVLDTGHSGEVLDVAVDAAGKRLATASDDGAIHIYEADTQNSSGRRSPPGPTGNGHSANNTSHAAHPNGGKEGGGSFSSTGPSWRLASRITARSGEGPSSPVTCVSWAPPAYYGCALVACSESGCVCLWSDFADSKQFEGVYTHQLPSPGRCVAWAPQEYGKLFAVGCATGAVVVFTGQGQTWDVQAFKAHHGCCFGLSFAPFFPPGALLMAPLEAEIDPAAPPPPVPIAPPRMVTCGGGKNVKVWVHCFSAPPPPASPSEEGQEPAPPESTWTPADLATGPMGNEGTQQQQQQPCFVKVAWAPNVGLPYTYIAAGTDDGHVAVWSQDGPYHPDSAWQFALLPQQMADRVTSLSWSSTGTFLLVSCADGTATMWKESSVGLWELVSEMENPTTV